MVALPHIAVVEVHTVLVGLQAVAGNKVSRHLFRYAAVQFLPDGPLLGGSVNLIVRRNKLHIGGPDPQIVEPILVGNRLHPAAVGDEILLVLDLIPPDQGADRPHIIAALRQFVVPFGVDGCQEIVPFLGQAHQHMALQVLGDGQLEVIVQVVQRRVFQQGAQVGGRLRAGAGGRPADGGAAGQNNGQSQGGRQSGGALPLSFHNGHQPFFQSGLFLAQGGGQHPHASGGPGGQHQQSLPVVLPGGAVHGSGHRLVTGELAGAGDFPPHHHHQGIEPVEAGHRRRQPFIEQIVPPGMGQLVGQDIRQPVVFHPHRQHNGGMDRPQQHGGMDMDTLQHHSAPARVQGGQHIPGSLPGRPGGDAHQGGKAPVAPHIPPQPQACPCGP